MRRFDFGIASYGNPEALARTLAAVSLHSQTSWRCFIINNQHPDGEIHARALKVMEDAKNLDPRFFIHTPEEGNIGYAGAVDTILRLSETEYIGYVDNDATVMTPGWDEKLCSILDRFHEYGIVFPGAGAQYIPRGEFNEVLWGVGFCWIVSRIAMIDASYINMPGDVTLGRYFDRSLGHQEEVDFQTRLRLAGYKIAALPSINVEHAATSSNNPDAVERISRGVVNWVDKWVRYFCGKNLNYHSPNVLRHEDWHTTALHMEQFFKLHLGEDFNANPEVVTINGTEYDLIRVPRLKGFYRNRII